ncbi:hypothetical protein PUNSTDRAFT_54044 [Punctularia strigosozonata HHB-11173 SS5]|uniref:uncharacterized protein n=1 Tax=Punctularia strigosozonata (strain HHB-11173) TaxID=741275 RepID=UPI00044176D5|nr:uncharacterized protein PUNSTDRAFT_54044 [Punctularia strigosozonata HHB-11173 SS5]EIN06638.1 hypothetical protein PUNSTDRAFT_54044 [Punctularia strigosozonata HHB-11173 SS5]
MLDTVEEGTPLTTGGAPYPQSTTRHASTIVATADFKWTIALPHEKRDCMRDSLRPVRWIFVDATGTHAVLISPYEANALLPDIRLSPHVRLFLYAPRARSSAWTSSPSCTRPETRFQRRQFTS